MTILFSRGRELPGSFKSILIRQQPVVSSQLNRDLCYTKFQHLGKRLCM